MSEDDATDSDDDWFESAISDDAGDDGASEEADATADADQPADETADSHTDETGDGARDTDADIDDATPETDSGPEAAGEPDESAGDPDFAPGGGDSPFDSSDPTPDDSPFGGTAGESGDPFQTDTSDGGGELFEDDFASAFGAAGGETGDFEQEDFESDIPRLDIGIEGLDQMIQGGVPQRHLMVAIGSAGTGKTTFGLQFLHHGLEQGDNAVFITLEQSREAIVDTADERGWDFAEYEANDQLAVVDLDPVEMANSLDNIRGELPALIEEFDADRFVLDSVSLLEMMYDDQARRRTEVFDFTRSLKRAGVTTLLTSEADEDNPYNSRYGIIEYLTDAVFILQYVRSETQETRLAVEIQKIRNANHSRETKPYEITMDGISVYQQANIF